MKIAERIADVSLVAGLVSFERLTEVVDIGANPIDGDPPYKRMLNAGLCNVTAFEPQPDALAALNAKKGPHERYFPDAVGDGQAHTLHIYRGSGWASLFEIDASSLRVFQHFHPLTDLIEKRPVQTKRLDDIADIKNIDFLKIDIQGGELSVFKNAKRALSQAVCIQTEVSFVPLYDGQPGFGEVDVELRAQGFLPHCFAAPYATRPIAPFALKNQPWQGLNQLVEADLVYVRDFEKPEMFSDDMLKHLAMIAHSCFGSVDLALRCLMLLIERGALEKGVGDKYLFGST